MALLYVVTLWADGRPHVHVLCAKEADVASHSYFGSSVDFTAVSATPHIQAAYPQEAHESDVYNFGLAGKAKPVLKTHPVVGVLLLEVQQGLSCSSANS